MKKMITMAVVLLILSPQFGSVAYAVEERFMVSMLMVDDTRVGEAVSLPAHSAAGRYQGYAPYETDFKVPRHLSIRNSHLLGGDLVKGPYRSARFDFGLFSIASDLNANRLSGVAQVGAAALTSLATHELGHVVIADLVGAEGVSVEIMHTSDGGFSLGSTRAVDVPNESIVPFRMGGEVFADYTFEYALQSYRKSPTLYNKSVMFISGLDFLRYTVFSLYLTEPRNHYDPVAVVNETGISREKLLGVAVAKTIMNAYRVYSGEDRFIPYFAVDKRLVTVNVQVRF